MKIIALVFVEEWKASFALDSNCIRKIKKNYT